MRLFSVALIGVFPVYITPTPEKPAVASRVSTIVCTLLSLPNCGWRVLNLPMAASIFSLSPSGVYRRLRPNLDGEGLDLRLAIIGERRGKRYGCRFLRQCDNARVGNNVRIAARPDDSRAAFAGERAVPALSAP